MGTATKRNARKELAVFPHICSAGETHAAMEAYPVAQDDIRSNVAKRADFDPSTELRTGMDHGTRVNLGAHDFGLRSRTDLESHAVSRIYSRIGRAGVPPQTAPAGISRNTPEPAAKVAPVPMFT